MMADEHTRAVVFLVGCIGTRVGLALLARAVIGRGGGDGGGGGGGGARAYYARARVLLVVVAVAIAVGFLGHYLFDTRPVAFEAGGVAWWNALRPVHAGLYIAFAALAARDHPRAWLVLLADALLGLVAWATYRGAALLGG